MYSRTARSVGTYDIYTEEITTHFRNVLIPISSPYLYNCIFFTVADTGCWIYLSSKNIAVKRFLVQSEDSNQPQIMLWKYSTYYSYIHRTTKVMMVFLQHTCGIVWVLSQRHAISCDTCVRYTLPLRGTVSRIYIHMYNFLSLFKAKCKEGLSWLWICKTTIMPR